MAAPITAAPALLTRTVECEACDDGRWACCDAGERGFACRCKSATVECPECAGTGAVEETYCPACRETVSDEAVGCEGCGSPDDHDCDADCAPHIDPKTCMCRVCGVEHGDPCPDCNGRGYHADGCTAGCAS